MSNSAPSTSPLSAAPKARPGTDHLPVLAEETRGAHAGDDYGPLGANVVTDLRAVAARIRDRMTASIIETGRDLLAVKGRLAHGEFIRWVEDECHLTPRTAQRMMAAADWARGKSDSVSHLPATILYAVLSPATPKTIRAEITRLIEAGDATEPAAVVIKIREAKDEERRKSEQRRLSSRTRAAIAQREGRERRRIEGANAEQLEHQKRRRQAYLDLADLLVREVRDQKLLVGLLKVADAELHHLVEQRFGAGPGDRGDDPSEVNDPSPSSAPQCHGTKLPMEPAAATPGCSCLMAVFQAMPAEHRLKVRAWVLRCYALEEPAPYADDAAPPFVALWLAAGSKAHKEFRRDLLVSEEPAP